ncbi:MAG TPA: FAD-linked oxidase C-terminal domain-containing protein [Acidobacteriota bacterium]|jgi:glycolate oxidase subunit GlcD|nr:FAD-linked oxidase C-terminal domain-containing protein [Acidobacteriota bacterium]
MSTIGDLAEELHGIVGKENIVGDASELLLYECDGLTFHRRPPHLVVFVQTAQQISDVVKVANRYRIPFLPRGAGTGLSGGAIPIQGGIIIELAPMQKIWQIDLENEFVIAEPGVINLALSEKLSPYGYYFAPDPSSQMSSTVGGNVAENSGGPHCLKYGVTVHHVLAVEAVLPDGTIVQLGSPFHQAGYDLPGVFTGSEGTLGIATKLWLRILRKPQAVRTFLAAFDSVVTAGEAVTRIIASGVLPAALEMMDRLTIQAVEASVNAAGYPTDAAAVLIVELDGLASELEELAARIEETLATSGAYHVREAKTDKERKQIWAGRKGAFGTMGRLNANLYLQDTVVPRSRLPEILEKVYGVAEKYQLMITSVFHAGDGNLHPLLLYNEKIPGDVEKVLAASEEIIRICIDAGGTLTGEHGIGLEKKDYMSWIFSPEDLAVMEKLHDIFNPDGLCNPSKIFPETKVCKCFVLAP